MAPFFVIPFKSSCVGSDMSILSDMRADLEASTALASPLKFPGCGGFFSSVASAKLPERGGSYSFIFGSGLLDELSSEDDGGHPVERSMFERSLLLGLCFELARMRSRSRLILSEIRRTGEVWRSR
ncbi:hypothetical protein F2Q68_00026004 [Brassica cretica]|uniref:Uncharacterized protein n=1 Tax=Brassica cretica TaxID=69181 RepID=A0A8S9ICI8_BRACR|nr:hypothetical protein F2Q68_00026004 [Brassica cretica]